MARKRKINDHGTGIPYHEVEALARVLLPEIQAFFKSEEGQRGVCGVESTTAGQTTRIDVIKAGTCSKLLPP